MIIIARHRRRLPVRDFLSGLALLLVLWFNRQWPRDPRRATPAQICRLAGPGHLPLTAERIPLQVSYAEHVKGVRQIEEYASGARAPLV